MTRSQEIVSKTKIIYDKPFIREGKLPATNLVIFMLYLRSILDGCIGADSDSFKSYATLIAQTKSDEEIDIISELKDVVYHASKFYGRPELDIIPLGIDEIVINKAIQDKDVNKLCEYILREYHSDKDNDFYNHDFFINELYFTFDQLSSMGGAIGRNKGFLSLDPSVTKLADRILNVHDLDVYADLVNGAGISTLAICSKACPEMYLADYAKDQMVLSEMLLAAFGKLKGEFIFRDSLFKAKVKESFADKIFMDPPIRVSAPSLKDVQECDGILLKDSSASSIMRACKGLKNNGKAVIAVPGFVLFGSQYGLDSVRKYILRNHMLEAIITLPNCWSTMFIPTHLLILSKKDNEKVRFIDIQNDAKYTRRNGLNEEGVQFVYDMYRTNDLSEFKGYAVDIMYRDVDYGTFVPSAYFKESNESKYSKSEIDHKLDELYRSLGEIMRDIAK